MSTMTRLPIVSSLPSGTAGDDIRLPFPSISTDSSPSIISPLSLPLPRGTSGYFDMATASPTFHPASTLRPYSKIATAGNYNFKGSQTQSQVYSPLSPNARGPAVPQPPQFLSPHLSPITREVQYQLQQQQRSTSLPPSYRGASPTGGRSQHSMAGSMSPAASVDPGMMRGMPVSAPFTTVSQIPNNNSLPSISSVSAGHPRSVSADAANAPSHVQMIRRLAQQNGRIREAWEAERKYMEANRERAEEVYKEERALMEEERAEWEDEKAGLLQEIERLQHLVMSLGGDPRRPSDASSGFANTSTTYASGQTFCGGDGEAVEFSPESMRSSRSSQGSGRQQGQHERNRTVVWTGTVPQFQHSTGPTNQTQQQLYSSNDAAPPTDATQAPETDSGPVPVVDIQEIHPELEGIPIKATSVQKSTFTDGPSQNTSKSSSRASSPSSGTSRPRLSSKESKEQTLQVLAAPESDRLTMHAGHTPSHSLSQLPTISTATTTASSSGDSTPTMSRADGTSSMSLATIEEGDPQPTHGPQDSNDQTCLSSETNQDAVPNFEAAEDPELRGPLMVRNMPAHDEIFFRRLSDKLEEVQKDTQAALPAVLKDSPQDDPHLADQVEPEVHPAADEESLAAHESGSSSESPKSGKGEELDIPLKIKRSFNFGAPFGEFR